MITEIIHNHLNDYELFNRHFIYNAFPKMVASLYSHDIY